MPGHVANLTEHVGCEAILERVGRIVEIEEVIDRGLGLLHGQVEAVLAAACYGQDGSGTLFAIGAGGEVGEVLLGHLTQAVGVDVADEVEGEVGSVSKTLLGNLEHAVVVHLMQHIHIKWLVAPAAVTQDVLN